MFCQYRRLAFFQYTLQTTQQGEWQNDAAILRLFEVTTQQVGNRPDERSDL